MGVQTMNQTKFSSAVRARASGNFARHPIGTRCGARGIRIAAIRPR